MNLIYDFNIILSNASLSDHQIFHINDAILQLATLEFLDAWIEYVVHTLIDTRKIHDYFRDSGRTYTYEGRKCNYEEAVRVMALIAGKSFLEMGNVTICNHFSETNLLTR